MTYKGYVRFQQGSIKGEVGVRWNSKQLMEWNENKETEQNYRASVSSVIRQDVQVIVTQYSAILSHIDSLQTNVKIQFYL